MIEQIKTAVLWLLILLSVIFTYQIWTFQPKYATMKSAEYIDNTQIGEEKKIHQVIKPKQIIFHHEGNFSPIEQLQFNDSLHENLFQGMKLEDFSLLTNKDKVNDNQSTTEMEFIYPDSISAEVIKDIYKITSNEQFLMEGIDQVIFSLIESEEKRLVLVKFVSFKEQLAMVAVTDLSVNRFEEAIKAFDSELFYQVFPYELTDYGKGFKKEVFLPVETEEVNRVTHFSTPIPPEHFKQVLFSDPSFVKHYLQFNGEESFTDGNRMVNVLNSGNILRYINPSFGDIAESSNKPVIISALDFLNSHGGITNSFYFDSIKSVASNEEITFRLFIDELPVYQSNLYGVNNLFEITINRVGGNQIEQYNRPLFSIEAEPINSTRTTILPSGHEVIDIIKNKHDFKPNLLTDINKGYIMTKQAAFVVFEPSWFIQYNGRWESIKVVETDDSEVDIGGLE